MERSPDTYLHKKFKKQLNIEYKPAPQQNDKENKATTYEELCQEKSEAQMQEKDCHSPVKSNQSIDNKKIVPNSSTKEHSVSNDSILARSSISIDNSLCVQSSTPCISNIVSSSHNEEQYKLASYKPASFDTTFSTNQTTNLVSSTLDKIFSKQVSKEDISSATNEELDLRDYKNDDVSVPDRHSNGKYVCKYCNLVCSKPSVLQKHIRAHTNERPYPCTDCGFSFKTRSNLYKHCRSRTHANRVLGTKSQEGCSDELLRGSDSLCEDNDAESSPMMEYKNKPYKPRFHTEQAFENYSKENMDENSRHADSDILSHHINEIISKNNSIVNPTDSSLLRGRISEVENVNNNEYIRKNDCVYVPIDHKVGEEPLNLTKSRKRSMSEIGEPVAQKSLIKELLLKNLYSDMQCPYCKMIFQTVTELELHKIRSCKGKPSEVKYTRSSSVNVASILTKNKNAFDDLPQLQNTVFPLSSPGPFLGKTRLVDSDKNKSFSFDSGNLPLAISTELSSGYLLSPIPFNKEKKVPVKLFGGEVKVHGKGETKCFKIDGKEDGFQNNSEYTDFGSKISENRVVKSSLQSGGTVLTNKPNLKKNDIRPSQNFIKVYENIAISPHNMPFPNFEKPQFSFDKAIDKSKTIDLPQISSSIEVKQRQCSMPEFKSNTPVLTNIGAPLTPIKVVDQSPAKVNCNMEINSEDTVKISQNVQSQVGEKPGLLIKKQLFLQKNVEALASSSEISSSCNPQNLLVNGKIVRYVPGMPGPVIAENDIDISYNRNIVAVNKQISSSASDITSPYTNIHRPQLESVHVTKVVPRVFLAPEIVERINRSPKHENMEVQLEAKRNDIKSPTKLLEAGGPSKEQKSPEPKKFARPNSLALKPTTAALKQHHGLTPTIFNQILISPDTPRVEKKYAQHFLHGNYFSYLGLKSSTKPVYCTLNKTQPFYVPHFKKLSMYSEWRQQDTKADKLYVSAYDSRQKSQRFTIAWKPQANLIMHSSYKFKISELASKCDKPDQKGGSVLGGYESNDDYTYIRGRGRGRYVCHQCGIRCKKPSMLKKHIRTHSNDRPYNCDHCNFSFKTKGNLTKHMKSKAHNKNYEAGGSSGSCPAMHSSDSDTEDSGMDSSDESTTTRNQEHEAAYGLLSLSQKTTESCSNQRDTPTTFNNTSVVCMTSEEIAHVSKTNYAKNKILDEKNSDLSYGTKKLTDIREPTHDEYSNSQPEYINKNIMKYLGKASVTRPLTYPYTSPFSEEVELNSPTQDISEARRSPETLPVDNTTNILQSEPKSINKFHVIQKYGITLPEYQKVEARKEITVRNDENTYALGEPQSYNKNVNYTTRISIPVPTIKVNDVVVQENISERKRKYEDRGSSYGKIQKNDEVMDLSMPQGVSKLRVNGVADDLNGKIIVNPNTRIDIDRYSKTIPQTSRSYHKFGISEEDMLYQKKEFNQKLKNKNGSVHLLQSRPAEEHSNSSDISIYDNSAMETLADVATKQGKLEGNTRAKNVASEFLKITMSENVNGPEARKVLMLNRDELMANAEGNKSCTICAKTFNKPSQLRLHMNIHYLERPYRCDPCSVSFRSKGHLQKHERSAGHHSKLASSPAQSSTEPRPFKCADCNSAFRIHGHLAKHLRSKMHIMKLENLAKVPFGLYAELERSNSLLTEINTSDGDQCLESLKTLAKKVFVNDPNIHQSVMGQIDIRETDEDIDS